MKAMKSKVFNRGIAPDAFLEELLEWGKAAPDEIFAQNSVPVDIFTVIKSSLGTPIPGAYRWDSLGHRRAAMLEAMRVHAGMESSWKWTEGVDRTNRTSMSKRAGEETGIFQVSFDSQLLGYGAMKPFAKEHSIDTIANFIPAMKNDHKLALEYYARLVRVSIAWAGPLLRHGNDSVYPWLSKAALLEWEALISEKSIA